MQNLLARLAALGILVGGFALTGDLGWLAERGQRVIGAAEVASAPAMAFVDLPSQSAAAPQPALARAPAATDAPSAPDAAPPPSFTPIDSTAPPPAAAAGDSIPVAEFRPPAGGPDRVTLAELRPGDRVVVWLESTRHRCLVFDLVEPAAGGALVYEAAAVTSMGQPLAAAGPPRRVIVTGQESSGVARGRLLRGGALHLAEAGVAGTDRHGRWLGPIESLAVID